MCLIHLQRCLFEFCWFLWKILKSYWIKLKKMFCPCASCVYTCVSWWWFRKYRRPEDEESTFGLENVISDAERQQKEKDALENKVQELSSKIEDLTAQLRIETKERASEARRNEECISKLERDLKKAEYEKQDALENKVQALSSKIEDLMAQLKFETKERATEARRNEECISKLERDLKKAEYEKQDALTRLSALMSVKLRDNNPNIADLSDQNRPTKLAEFFSELYDNEWTDAFTAISKVLTERQTITFLLDIVMDAYCFCSEELDRSWLIVSDWYLDDSLPNEQQMQKQLKDSRKVAVVKMTHRVSEIYQSHLQSVCAIRTLHDLLSHEVVSSYVTQSVKLGLLMCANDPPVVIECQDCHSIVPVNNTSEHEPNTASVEVQQPNGVNTPNDKEKTVNTEKPINEENADKDEKQLGQEQLNMQGQPIVNWGSNSKEFQNNLEEPNTEGIQTGEVIKEIDSKSDVQQTFHRRPFDREKYKEYTSRGPYLEYIVWPVMYLHQGGPMLGKGVAQGTRGEVVSGEEECWTWKKPE